VEKEIKGSTILLKKGDITLEDVSVIVNAANSSLMGGGGVDGAIHRAGGPQILEECRKIREVHGKLPTGKAVITNGGMLTAGYVIHTVGPVWSGGGNSEDNLLRDCYINSLALAVENELFSIAFPSISTGVYRFPVERAAEIAIQAVVDFLSTQAAEINMEVRHLLFSAQDLSVYSNVLGNISDEDR